MIFTIYRTKYIRISDVINECFECLKFYVFRLEYSLNEYEQRQIPWTYKTFKRTIWITLNSWINIFTIEQLLHFERSDLLLQFQIFTFIILEALWYKKFRMILTYNYNAHFIVRKYGNHFNDDHEIEQSNRRHLTHFVRIGNLVSKIMSFNILMAMFVSGVFVVYKFFSFYNAGNIGFIEMIIYITLLINLLIRSAYLIGLITFWPQFIKEYDNINAQMFMLNQASSMVFFVVEAISKIAIIFCTLFYSKQSAMNIYNTIIVLFLLAAFIYSNGIYLCTAKIPDYNEIGCKELMNWLTRFQMQQQRRQANRGRNYWQGNRSRLFAIRDTVRSNLFVQQMSQNRFGFSCGQLFFITKSKFIEVFLLSFVLSSLFYKKICL
ncbi:hypothetical protein DERF_014416 [Dermatophagoides farinae]|uniref:Uncharacterized protein n=1 Tax=Dermatophagoides farinae TaxID=6954 RepID=A0A922KSZ5_DERFA|nr:hypothetical protein DERF_014416 [Dermatophagoides farinae]